MSTIAVPQSKSTPIFSRQIDTPRRSFFFDVKRAPRGELFFTISELTGQGSVWHRSRVLIPADQAREFYQGLCEAIKAMREAEKAEAAVRPVEKPAPVSKRPTRASGRASQGANRKALLSSIR